MINFESGFIMGRAHDMGGSHSQMQCWIQLFKPLILKFASPVGFALLFFLVFPSESLSPKKIATKNNFLTIFLRILSYTNTSFHEQCVYFFKQIIIDFNWVQCKQNQTYLKLD